MMETITQADIEAAELNIEIARQKLNEAKDHWDNASFWERIDGSRKRKYEAAVQALKEAQGYYQQIVSVDYAEASVGGTAGQGTSILPVLLAGLVAVGVLIFVLKKRA